VQAAGPEPISPFSIARDDANVALNKVALGTWSVSLSATTLLANGSQVLRKVLL
jgi:hypothetical protein